MEEGVWRIVGGGVAGLAAALAATRAGGRVALYEASPQAGGRCRTVRGPDGFTHDNGTHVLIGANPRALALLDEIGARARWIEPEPQGLPVYDARSRALHRVGLSPASWLAKNLRPPGLAFADLPRFARLLAPGRDRAIGEIFAGSGVLESFVEPLTLAVLNTPVAVASARRLGRALRQVLAPGGGRLYAARNGLGPDLVEPAIATLIARGAQVETGARLRAIETAGGRMSALLFARGGNERVELGPHDRVILALPPSEIGRFLPGIAAPTAFEPILNAHFALAEPAPGAVRFIGLTGALSQWLIVRRDHVSVTVSAAAGEAMESDPDNLLVRIWSEIDPALRAAGLELHRGERQRIVKEKRATIRQEAGLPVYAPRAPWPRLALAGDWIGPLPATIESATISGENAVRALKRDAP
ncbi:MAG: FAD-binding protein [Salinarimonadaceae bacterium]|nr:MAG: FAD-binding protein [Salinarimonadaceae bacterium]